MPGAGKLGGNKNTFNVDDVGYATAAAAGLAAGDTTIASASVGTKQGFSIIKYTGYNDTAVLMKWHMRLFHRHLILL